MYGKVINDLIYLMTIARR